MTSESEKRTSKRFRLDENGIVYDTDMNRLPIKLIDISHEGMKIAGVDLVVDQEVTIEWQNMELDAVVVWSIGEAAGLMFDDKLEDSHPLIAGAG